MSVNCAIMGIENDTHLFIQFCTNFCHFSWKTAKSSLLYINLFLWLLFIKPPHFVILPESSLHTILTCLLLASHRLAALTAWSSSSSSIINHHRHHPLIGLKYSRESRYKPLSFVFSFFSFWRMNFFSASWTGDIKWNLVFCYNLWQWWGMVTNFCWHWTTILQTMLVFLKCSVYNVYN